MDNGMTRPDIESVSAAVHEAWIASKRAQGVLSRLSESGEELMVPYSALSEAAKDLDRGTVRAVFHAIEAVSAVSVRAVSRQRAGDAAIAVRDWRDGYCGSEAIPWADISALVLFALQPHRVAPAAN